MKSKLTRIWGVGLVLVLIVGLMAWSAPIAADTLEWDTEDGPEEFEVGNIVDLAVSEGGLITYTLNGTHKMWVSTDQGESWDDATIIEDSDDPTTILNGFVLAVAPDDPKFVAVAGTNATQAHWHVYITEDGGATWDTLGDINGASITAVNDIAVSMESGDNRFVAVAGTDATDAEVWYYEIGALGADWEEISDTGSFHHGDIAGAVAFSPNFNSDEILATVTFNDTTYNELQIFSFNTEDWNDDVGGFSGYPVVIDPEGGTPDDLVAADIAMSPDYLGSDDDLRQIFVAIAGDFDPDPANVEDTDGIFFIDDDDAEALEYGTLMHSVDFDGTNLVAGSENGTTVYYSSDPLEGEDADVDNSSSSKSPSGDGQVVARFAGGDLVVAGTRGNDSAISVSRDLGENFNDLTLIDGGLAADGLIDLAISTDGSAKYLLTADADTDMSLWRYNEDNELWERVRFVEAEANWANYIIRVAPEDPDIVYLAETGATTMYYSSDGGASKWHNRSSRYPINDIAVETTGEVLYVLTTNGYVSKSVNTGFTWDGKETTGQAGDYMIVSLGEDMLLVGGDAGADSVSYSTDGNESWTDLDPIDEGGNVQVTAEGLADGDYIWAVTDAEESGIYWLEIGEDEWEDDLGALTSGHVGRGIALADGILYILSENATITTDNFSRLTRFLDPWGDEEGDESIADVEDAVFDAVPTALRVAMGSTELWAVDSLGAGLYMYEDTISQAGPTLKSPANGFVVPMNEISGDPANVNLVWTSPSDAIDEFEWEIALDEDFDEGLTDGTVANGFDEGDTVNELVPGTNFVPGTTYYWRVKVTDPVESPWSESRSFTVAEAEAPAPVTVTPAPPAPEITIEVPPAPEVVLPAPVVEIPEVAPAIPAALLWTIVVIGAILVVALIVLIVRTRKVT